jgi:hypothetical protein
MQVYSFELVTLFKAVTTVCLNGTKTCAEVISRCWSFYCECCASVLARSDNWVDIISKHTWLECCSLDIRNEFRCHITFKDLLRKICYVIVFYSWGFLVGVWVVAFGRRWKQHFRGTCCFLFVGDALSGHIVWKKLATQTNRSGFLRTEDRELGSFISM